MLNIFFFWSLRTCWRTCWGEVTWCYPWKSYSSNCTCFPNYCRFGRKWRSYSYSRVCWRLWCWWWLNGWSTGQSSSTMSRLAFWTSASHSSYYHRPSMCAEYYANLVADFTVVAIPKVLCSKLTPKFSLMHTKAIMFYPVLIGGLSNSYSQS